MGGVARRGRPVAIVCAQPARRVLRDEGPPRRAEPYGSVARTGLGCSHLGDRFAATMVLHQPARASSRITVDNAGAVLDAYEQGRVVPDLLTWALRLHRQEQAAQSLARAQGSGPTASTPSSRWERLLSTVQRSEVTLAANPSVTVRARESTVPLGTLPRAGRRCWQKRGNTR